MQLIRGLKNFPKLIKPSVLTIGNFDGIHLAHQKILQEVVKAAKKIDAISIVMIFEPTPQEFFMGEKASARLTNLREKLDLLHVNHIDYVWLLKFNQSLAELSAEQFVQDIVLAKLNLKQLIIGDDFEFGKNRGGDFKLLQQFSDEHDFELIRTSEISHDEARISSTRVRQALAVGDLAHAAKLLGRPYTIMGRVLHGAKRGRQIGFPTANIGLKRKVTPLRGVFAVKVGEKMGVANIGTRPTVDGTRTVLEVHLFDFNQNLYGQLIEVEFRHKIRDEQRFASLDELKAKIAQDVVDAKQFFH